MPAPKKKPTAAAPAADPAVEVGQPLTVTDHLNEAEEHALNGRTVEAISSMSTAVRLLIPAA